MPQPISGVQSIFGFLLGNIRPGNQDTVVAVKRTVLAIAWLAINQSVRDFWAHHGSLLTILAVGSCRSAAAPASSTILARPRFVQTYASAPSGRTGHPCRRSGAAQRFHQHTRH